MSDFEPQMCWPVTSGILFNPGTWCCD